MCFVDSPFGELAQKIRVTNYYNDGFPELHNQVNVIFGGHHGVDCSRRKLTGRKILSIEPAVLTPLKWSDTPISFSKID